MTTTYENKPHYSQTQTWFFETPGNLGNHSLSLPAVTLQTSYNQSDFISIYSQSQSSPASVITLIKVLCVFSFAQLCLTLWTAWTVALLAPLSMGISRQEYWSRLSFSPPGDLPKPGTEPTFPASLALAGGFFTLVASGKPPLITLVPKCKELLCVFPVLDMLKQRSKYVLQGKK